MRLRTSLFLLSVATAAPLIAFALLAAGFVVQHENENLVSAAKARNRATMSAVDAEMRGTIHTLQALAVGRTLLSADLRAFDELARAVLATQPAWTSLILTDPAGRQLVNAGGPPGTPLPDTPDTARSIQTAVATRKAVIDDLAATPLQGDRLGIPVRMPVVRDDRVLYVLTAVISTESIQRLIAEQKMAEGWASGLVDNAGRLIARVPPKPAGVPASPDYLNNVRAAHEGWYRGRTLEGVDSYTAFLRSDMTGWTIGYAVPTPLVFAGAVRAGWLMGAGILLSVGAAALIGYWLGRGIERPMSRLGHAAALLGEGRRPPEVASNIDEVGRLSKSIDAAWSGIERRDNELRRSEAELRAQADELRRADANKSQFLALLSHELRNPLAPLRNGIALLRRHPDREQLASTQAMMERQASHLARLIDDLLDVGRIDRGQLELRREQVALEPILATAIETAQPAIEAKQQVLAVHPAAVPIFLDADPVRLGQVISNLLNNASRFASEGGRIAVTTAAGHDEATITVADDGVGFGEADRRRIFDMFVRLGGDGAPGGGLGIGLTIVRSLVEMHGGRVEAYSAGPGQGATFTVHLPRLAALQAPASAPPQERASTNRRRVLVVDDNVDAANSMAQILRLEGFDVREAYDGKSAFDVACAFLPDVAFLDLNMPGMSGIELAGALRTQPWAGRLSLVALTGMGQMADIQATRKAGFDGHLTKPASPEEVVRIAAAPPAAGTSRAAAVGE